MVDWGYRNTHGGRPPPGGTGSSDLVNEDYRKKHGGRPEPSEHRQKRAAKEQFLKKHPNLSKSDVTVSSTVDDSGHTQYSIGLTKQAASRQLESQLEKQIATRKNAEAVFGGEKSAALGTAGAPDLVKGVDFTVTRQSGGGFAANLTSTGQSKVNRFLAPRASASAATTGGGVESPPPGSVESIQQQTGLGTPLDRAQAAYNDRHATARRLHETGGSTSESPTVLFGALKAAEGPLHEATKGLQSWEQSLAPIGGNSQLENDLTKYAPRPSWAPEIGSGLIDFFQWSEKVQDKQYDALLSGNQSKINRQADQDVANAKAGAAALGAFGAEQGTGAFNFAKEHPGRAALQAGGAIASIWAGGELAEGGKALASERAILPGVESYSVGEASGRLSGLRSSAGKIGQADVLLSAGEGAEGPTARDIVSGLAEHGRSPTDLGRPISTDLSLSRGTTVPGLSERFIASGQRATELGAPISTDLSLARGKQVPSLSERFIESGQAPTDLGLPLSTHLSETRGTTISSLSERFIESGQAPTDLGQPLAADRGVSSLSERAAPYGRRFVEHGRAPTDLGRPISTDLGVEGASELFLRSGAHPTDLGRPLATDLGVPSLSERFVESGQASTDLGRPITTDLGVSPWYETPLPVQRGLPAPPVDTIFGERETLPSQMTPAETEILGQAFRNAGLESEATKMESLRATQLFTQESPLQPDAVEPIIGNVLEEHGVPRGASGDIVDLFKREDAKLYGSITQPASAEAVGEPGLNRVPRDLDVGEVTNPTAFGEEATNLINRFAGEEVVTLEEGTPTSVETGGKLFDIHGVETPESSPGARTEMEFGIRNEADVRSAEGVRTTTLSHQTGRKGIGSIELITREPRTMAGFDVGNLGPMHEGRLKDIPDYFIGEQANIEALRQLGKAEKAATAEESLNEFVDAFGGDMSAWARREYEAAGESRPATELFDFGQSAVGGSSSPAVSAASSAARSGSASAAGFFGLSSPRASASAATTGGGVESSPFASFFGESARQRPSPSPSPSESRSPFDMGSADSASPSQSPAPSGPASPFASIFSPSPSPSPSSPSPTSPGSPSSPPPGSPSLTSPGSPSSPSSPPPGSPSPPSGPPSPPTFTTPTNSPYSPLLFQRPDEREPESKHGVDLGLKGIHSIFRNPLGGRSRRSSKRSKGSRKDNGHAAALDLFAGPGESSKGSKRQGGRRESNPLAAFFGGGSKRSTSKRSQGRSRKGQSGESDGFASFGLGGRDSGRDRARSPFEPGASTGAAGGLFGGGGSGSGASPSNPSSIFFGGGGRSSKRKSKSKKKSDPFSAFGL